METISQKQIKLPVACPMPPRDVIVKRMAERYGDQWPLMAPLVQSCAEVAEHIFFEAGMIKNKMEWLRIVTPRGIHWNIYCPSCQKKKIHISHNYCPHCGKQIEWIK